MPGESVSCDRIAGLLVGTAVGDSLGLPREGLSARRAGRLFGPSPLRQAFVAGRGMCSDDTEHACMTAQAWLTSSGDVDRFARSLAWRLRLWLLGLPAGIGYATLRACCRLWIGFPPGASGVASAGNGPAMRAPVLAACCLRDPSLLPALVRVSTRLTHSDPRAEQGALAVALTAWEALTGRETIDPVAVLQRVHARVAGAELRDSLERVARLVAERADLCTYSAESGVARGVTGYINSTVPAALFCWARWPGDFRRAVESVIELGGDTDSTAAITGALAGATADITAIPAEWSARLLEWPRSQKWLRRLAQALATATGSNSGKPVSLFWPALPIRNAIFAAVVIGHGLRRLLPPY